MKPPFSALTAPRVSGFRRTLAAILGVVEVIPTAVAFAILRAREWLHPGSWHVTSEKGGRRDE